MEHISRVDVLEASEDLVEEVANVVVAQVLGLEQLVQVCLHQVLDNVATQSTIKEVSTRPFQTLLILSFFDLLEILIDSADSGFSLFKVN